MDEDLRQTASEWSELWRRVGLIALAIAYGAVTFVVTALVAFNTQGLCDEPAGPHALVEARTHLLVVLTVSPVPWLLGAFVAFRRGHRWSVLAATAVLVSLYPAYGLVSALVASPADWTSSWCF